MAVNIKELMNKFSGDGVVAGISVRPERSAPVKRLDSVTALKDKGLDGDRYNSKGGSRQVTLIQSEHIAAVASFLRQEELDYTLTRRNILVTGINLLALKGKSFAIGSVILEYTGECHPCSRMEEALGEGGYNAMRGHGGITAKVVEGGDIHLGDVIAPLTETF